MNLLVGVERKILRQLFSNFGISLKENVRLKEQIMSVQQGSLS